MLSHRRVAMFMETEPIEERCIAKLRVNPAGDRRVNRRLRAKGWKVARVWEHELRRRNEAKLIRRLSNLCPRRP